MYDSRLIWCKNSKTIRRPLPRTPLGELTALPLTPSLMGGGWLPLPKNPHPGFGPSGFNNPFPIIPNFQVSSDATVTNHHQHPDVSNTANNANTANRHRRWQQAMCVGLSCLSLYRRSVCKIVSAATANHSMCCRFSSGTGKKRKAATGKRRKLLSVSIFSSNDNISRPPVLGLLWCWGCSVQKTPFC